MTRNNQTVLRASLKLLPQRRPHLAQQSSRRPKHALVRHTPYARERRRVGEKVGERVDDATRPAHGEDEKTLCLVLREEEVRRSKGYVEVEPELNGETADVVEWHLRVRRLSEGKVLAAESERFACAARARISARRRRRYGCARLELVEAAVNFLEETQDFRRRVFWGGREGRAEGVAHEGREDSADFRESHPELGRRGLWTLRALVTSVGRCAEDEVHGEDRWGWR